MSPLFTVAMVMVEVSVGVTGAGEQQRGGGNDSGQAVPEYVGHGVPPFGQPSTLDWRVE